MWNNADTPPASDPPLTVWNCWTRRRVCSPVRLYIYDYLAIFATKLILYNNTKVTRAMLTPVYPTNIHHRCSALYPHSHNSFLHFPRMLCVRDHMLVFSSRPHWSVLTCRNLNCDLDRWIRIRAVVWVGCLFVAPQRFSVTRVSSALEPAEGEFTRHLNINGDIYITLTQKIGVQRTVSSTRAACFTAGLPFY